MYPLTDKQKELYHNLSNTHDYSMMFRHASSDGIFEVENTKRNSVLEVTGENISGEKFELRQSVCDDEELLPGGLISSMCTFSLLDVEDVLLGREMRLYSMINRQEISTDGSNRNYLPIRPFLKSFFLNPSIDIKFVFNTVTNQYGDLLGIRMNNAYPISQTVNLYDVTKDGSATLPGGSYWIYAGDFDLYIKFTNGREISVEAGEYLAYDLAPSLAFSFEEVNITFYGTHSDNAMLTPPYITKKYNGAYEPYFRLIDDDTYPTSYTSCDLCVPMGVYIVESEKYTTIEKVEKNIVAYDYLFNYNKTINGIFWRLFWDGEKGTLAHFRNALLAFEYIKWYGGTQVNDNKKFYFPKTISGDFWDMQKTTVLDMLRYFCEVNGSWGFINRYGEYEEKDIELDAGGLTDIQRIIDDNENNYQYPEIKVSSIVNSTPRSAITGIATYNSDSETETVVYSSGVVDSACVKILDNPFISYAQSDTEVVTNITNALTDTLSNFSKSEYTPMDLEIQGSPYLDIGGTVYIENGEEYYTSFIAQRTLTGVSSLTDHIVSTGLEGSSADYTPTSGGSSYSGGGSSAKVNFATRALSDSLGRIIKDTYALKSDILNNLIVGYFNEGSMYSKYTGGIFSDLISPQEKKLYLGYNPIQTTLEDVYRSQPTTSKFIKKGDELYVGCEIEDNVMGTGRYKYEFNITIPENSSIDYMWAVFQNDGTSNGYLSFCVMDNEGNIVNQRTTTSTDIVQYNVKKTRLSDGNVETETNQTPVNMYTQIRIDGTRISWYHSDEDLWKPELPTEIAFSTNNTYGEYVTYSTVDISKVGEVVFEAHLYTWDDEYIEVYEKTKPIPKEKIRHIYNELKGE